MPDGTITLADLKKQNTEEEGAAVAAAEQAEKDADAAIEAELLGSDTVPAGDDTAPAGDDTAAGADDTVPGAESDDWMKPEGDDTVAGAAGKVDDSTAAAIRRKYQGQAKAAKDELAEAKKEIEELRKKATQPAVGAIPDAPKRDAYETDEAYLIALADHRLEVGAQRQKSEQAAQTRKQQQEQFAAEVEQEVEQHYTRAAALAAKSKIKPETYQAADRSVREAVATVFGESADAVTDTLIARVGPGSEKALYYLGVNPSKQAELLATFKKDPTGLAAAVYLTRLAERLNMPKVQETKAPEPPDDVRGDKAGGGNDKGKLYRQYKDAHAKGDTQAALNIKLRAKGMKVDVSKW